VGGYAFPFTLLPLFKPNFIWYNIDHASMQAFA
jgi:hypothetical protein